MRIIQNLSQGSDEWKQWRKSKITATDCPIICEVNPWESPYQLWRRKLSLDPEKQITEEMQRGMMLESKAREIASDLTGIEFIPCNVLHDNEWMAASLDGIDALHSVVVEIKCGQKSFEQAKEGFIPEYYQYQMLHQMEICSVDKVLYFCYNGEKHLYQWFHRDQSKIDQLIEKEKEFYYKIQILEEPSLIDLDYKDMSGDREWELIEIDYLFAKEQIEYYESLQKKARERLISLAGESNAKGNCLKLKKILSKGNLDWNGIMDEYLKDIDLEKHRKPTKESWRITSDN